MNKKIKLLLLCILSLTLLFTKSNDVLAVECDTKTAEQLAKIIYHEVGADTAKNKDDNFFQRLTTASIVLMEIIKDIVNIKTIVLVVKLLKVNKVKCFI